MKQRRITEPCQQPGNSAFACADQQGDTQTEEKGGNYRPPYPFPQQALGADVSKGLLELVNLSVLLYIVTGGGEHRFGIRRDQGRLLLMGCFIQVG